MAISVIEGKLTAPVREELDLFLDTDGTIYFSPFISPDSFRNSLIFLIIFFICNSLLDLLQLSQRHSKACACEVKEKWLKKLFSELIYEQA